MRRCTWHAWDPVGTQQIRSPTKVSEGDRYNPPVRSEVKSHQAGDERALDGSRPPPPASSLVNPRDCAQPSTLLLRLGPWLALALPFCLDSDQLGLGSSSCPLPTHTQRPSPTAHLDQSRTMMPGATFPRCPGFPQLSRTLGPCTSS